MQASRFDTQLSYHNGLALKRLLNPTALAGQLRTMFVPAGVIVRNGLLTVPGDKPNTVPFPALPPFAVVPYKTFPDMTRPPKAPYSAVPCKVLPD
jgi:hypothetical protein